MFRSSRSHFHFCACKKELGYPCASSFGFFAVQWHIVRYCSASYLFRPVFQWALLRFKRALLLLYRSYLLVEKPRVRCVCKILHVHCFVQTLSSLFTGTCITACIGSALYKDVYLKTATKGDAPLIPASILLFSLFLKSSGAGLRSSSGLFGYYNHQPCFGLLLQRCTSNKVFFVNLFMC